MLISYLSSDVCSSDLRWTAAVVPLQPVEFVEEALVSASLFVGGGDLLDDRHQCLGNEASAVRAEVAAGVRVVAGGFGDGRTGARQEDGRASGRVSGCTVA